MLPAWTTLSGDYATCTHGGFIAVCTPDGWHLWKGRQRIGRGTEAGAAGRAAALEAMKS